jgi:hypothetical protein
VPRGRTLGLHLGLQRRGYEMDVKLTGMDSPDDIRKAREPGTRKEPRRVAVAKQRSDAVPGLAGGPGAILRAAPFPQAVEKRGRATPGRRSDALGLPE